MLAGPIFKDVSSKALGGNASYHEQMLPGLDHWRTVLDAACGIDVYGNNGLAVGDFDNDGFDDFYVCQPSGLPNRLYRNRGDGTFEDVTEAAGVNVLDHTACALFADMNNNGRQDLLLVCSNGPLLFLNQGNGKFQLQQRAFSFAQAPQGTFTAASIADYDRDGWLDVYFCLYSYYQGLDQYRFPVPYHDAQNGPPNFLLRNNGDGTFRDVTASVGLNQNNNRYSFACGWSDYNNDGWPDLYVANDFGRKNLYRNNGDGTFTDVAEEAGVEDIGAGMGVCWLDHDNDGRQDLYVPNMWTAEGLRVTMQEGFMNKTPETVRAQYRKHASGNSLLRNEGNGRFRDKSSEAKVEVGRWAWSSDAWDFDHDGYPDLYIVNGMVSGTNRRELNSFFWRQVVAQSPLELRPERRYEQGWNAINELIRSDRTWSGYERNLFYANNRDGTFSDISAVVGLDFLEDGRSFALADIDHDGRLELILKNRDTPQLRVLRNELPDLGHSIAFRLRGRKGNRDAIGAQVVIETERGRQSRFLQAGSGFLSQHTKEIFFGLGSQRGPIRAIVRWPSGGIEEFENVPMNSRITIEEGAKQFRIEPFASLSDLPKSPVAPQKHPARPSRFGTWLLVPLAAPDFELPDPSGHIHALRNFRGGSVLLSFWTTQDAECQQLLRIFQEGNSRWARHGVQLVTINVDGSKQMDRIKTLLREKRYSFLTLLANDDVAAIYNILYRYFFDRHRDLRIPTSFLLDAEGLIVKVYQGVLEPEDLQASLASMPRTAEERLNKGLPFPGRFYGGAVHRNTFTYGVAYHERGYFDQAMASFQETLRNNPDYAEAHYNLGSLYLQKQMRTEAKRHFQKALQLRPDYPDALNNVGLIAAEEGEGDEAARYFQEAIRRRPNNATALLNLGNLYRQNRRLEEAKQVLEQALEFEPNDPEVNYSLGMLFAQKDDTERAREYLQQAVKLRPDYPEALNNLGVLYLRTGQSAEAVAALKECIRVAASFDQAYLNLARAYVATGERQKAQEILRELLDRQPQHPTARKMLDQLAR